MTHHPTAAEIRDALKKATPRPWTYCAPAGSDNRVDDDGGFIEDHDMGRVAVLDKTAEDPAEGYVPGWRHRHNGALIVLLVNHAESLLAAVEAGEALLRRALPMIRHTHTVASVDLYRDVQAFLSPVEVRDGE